MRLNPFKKEVKSSVGVAQMVGNDQHEYSMRGLEKFADEGYGLNPTIFSCISLIAKNAASITPKVKVNGEPVEGHPLELLLDMPNADCGGVEFRTEAFSWILLTGNVFCEIVKSMKDELWHWQPYDMSIDKGRDRMPLRYVFNQNGPSKKVWDVDKKEMMHWGLFNPSPKSAFMGMSPLQAAASSGDQLNAANKWRYNLYKNDCRPAGILSTDLPISDADHKTLRQRLLNFVKEKTESFLLLGGGLKWQQLGMSPKDADFLLGSKFNKLEICEVFGVPPQLLGIEGSQTFANFEEARYAFWLNTVIPLLDLYYSELNRWLAVRFGQNVEIYYDESEITALDYVKAKKNEAALNSGVLTMNEKRALLGYPLRDEPEADEVMIDSGAIPLGFDVFTAQEQDMKELAGSMKKMGVKDYEQKAFDALNDQ